MGDSNKWPSCCVSLHSVCVRELLLFLGWTLGGRSSSGTPFALGHGMDWTSDEVFFVWEFLGTKRSICITWGRKFLIHLFSNIEHISCKRIPTTCCNESPLQCLTDWRNQLLDGMWLLFGQVLVQHNDMFVHFLGKENVHHHVIAMDVKLDRLRVTSRGEDLPSLFNVAEFEATSQQLRIAFQREAFVQVIH